MSASKPTCQPNFLALNHRGKTPVFVDVDPLVSPTFEGSSEQGVSTTINVNESIAILLYLETYHNPDRPLLPPVSKRASRATALARIHETENLHHAYDALEDAYFDAQNARRKFADDERIRLIRVIEKELGYWDVYASQSAFIAGDIFGLADCAFFPLLAYMIHRGFHWQRTPHQEGVGTDSARAVISIKAVADDSVAWPCLKAYYDRVWERGGTSRCAQRAQPDGWDKPGRANLWNGTRGNAKPRYEKRQSPMGVFPDH